MADLATTAQNGKSQVTTMPSRSPLAEWFGADPFDLFRNFYSPQSLGMGLAQGGIDITRTESGYAVEIPVAGYKSDEIQVTMQDSVLSVSGKSDRRSFTRSLLVPENIDQENVEARIENGLLSLTLHLHPKAQPKQIPIKT